MGLRIAVKEDFVIIKELIDALIKESSYSKLFKDYTLSENMVHLYTNPDTLNEKICLLSLNKDLNEIGLGVFDIVPWLYNDVNLKLARLAYIYIKPEFRKQGYRQELETAFEYWGKEVGANYYSKGAPSEGYQMFEVIYMKEVK